MTAVKLLLSQARRLSRLQHASSPLPFLPFHRSLSSSSSSTPPQPPQTDPEPALNIPSQSQSVPVQPVSYAPKPKDPTPQLQQQEQEEQPETQVDKHKQEEQLRAQLGLILNHIPSPQAPRPTPEEPTPEEPRPTPEGPSQSFWSREDLRYVKNVPNIAPVSYPTRVAPLPEDRVGVPEEDGEVKKEGVSEEVERESRRIDADSRVRRRPIRSTIAEEEKVVLPFPMLIKPEKKNEKRPVLDLMDAIREVKVSVNDSPFDTI